MPIQSSCPITWHSDWIRTIERHLLRPAACVDDDRVTVLESHRGNEHTPEVVRGGRVVGGGQGKIDRLNAGEVPIFLDSGIQPVFMGQAILGDKMPNLTYLTVYEDQAAKDRGWDNFRKHPDWKVLSGVQKYKGSVSKIHKINLVPLTSSQL